MSRVWGGGRDISTLEKIVWAILDCTEMHRGIARRLCARVHRDSRESRVVLGCRGGGEARTWRTRIRKAPQSQHGDKF